MSAPVAHKSPSRNAVVNPTLSATQPAAGSANAAYNFQDNTGFDFQDNTPYTFNTLNR